MFELVLHFIGADRDFQLAMHQEQHVAAIYDSLEECEHDREHDREHGSVDIEFMVAGVSARVLEFEGVAHVFVVVHCGEIEEEAVV